MRAIRKICCVSALFLTVASPVFAGVSRQERKEAKQLFSGPLYMRFNAPCTQGRHPFGIYYSALVEVSPTGTNTEASGGASVGWYHASSTVWSVRINDLVELEEMEWEEEGEVEIELEGAGPNSDGTTVVKFVDINSLQDFQAAFDQTFSRQPLQEEHPDWPPEIRQAIAERRLVDGMTKRQAFYVVGTPSRVDKTTEGEKTVETWTLPKQGVEFGFFLVRTGDHGAPPETLRFEDGLLVSASTSTGAAGLDLDNP